MTNIIHESFYTYLEILTMLHFMDFFGSSQGILEKKSLNLKAGEIKLHICHSKYQQYKFNKIHDYLMVDRN